jgi:hypothetical protein
MKHAIIENQQLTFTDGRFYQRPGGEWVPSVTTVLEAYPKPYALLQWMKEQGTKTDEIIAAAGRRGTSVHDMTERFDRGEEVNLFDEYGKPNCTLEEWGMFERYVDFSQRYCPDFQRIETRYVGPEFAGTVDRIGTLSNGKRFIVDIKTSNGIYDSYWLQLAAYFYLYKLLDESPMQIDGVAILWLNAKTRTDKEYQGKGWQLIMLDNSEELRDKFELFKSVLAIWAATNADKKPRQWTYGLKHRKEVQP